MARRANAASDMSQLRRSGAAVTASASTTAIKAMTCAASNRKAPAAASAAMTDLGERSPLVLFLRRRWPGVKWIHTLVASMPNAVRKLAPICYANFTFFSGRLRTGLPVAAKIAFSTAGATTLMVGSPTPPQKS